VAGGAGEPRRCECVFRPRVDQRERLAAPMRAT
jgi:hypothetical protein